MAVDCDDNDDFLADDDEIGGSGGLPFMEPLTSDSFNSGKAKGGRLSGTSPLLDSGAA